MRRSETVKVSELIRLFIREFNLEQGLLENRVLNLWDESMGRMVAQATTKKFIKDGKLFIYLNSSVVRQELFMMRTEIVKELNRRAGQEVITELILK